MCPANKAMASTVAAASILGSQWDLITYNLRMEEQSVTKYGGGLHNSGASLSNRCGCDWHERCSSLGGGKHEHTTSAIRGLGRMYRDYGVSDGLHARASD